MIKKFINLKENKNFGNFVVATAASIVAGLVLMVAQFSWWPTNKLTVETNSKKTNSIELNGKLREDTLTAENVLNFAYTTPFGEYELTKYTNGKFYHPCVSTPDCDRASIDTFVIADLNYDTRHDAVVWTVFSPEGGNGIFQFLHILISDLNGVHLGPSIEMENKCELKKIMVKEGIISIEYIGHGPNDALCCPTERKTLNLKLINNRLVNETTGDEL